MVALSWLGLEEPHGDRQRLLVVVLLALVPVLARPRWLRPAVLVASVLVVLRLALATEELDLAGGLPQGLRDGVLRFYEVILPLQPEREPLMHGMILLAVFAFCLTLAAAVHRRQPIAASLVLVLGTVWPATLRSPHGALELGALVLGACLFLFVGLRPAPGRVAAGAAASAAAVIAVAVALSSSPAIAKGAFLEWKTWDLPASAGVPVSVAYVWDSNYEGIDWPEAETTLLRIKAPRRALYWRATTLDSFTGYGWVESPSLTIADADSSDDRAELLSDPLLPRRARGAGWLRQDVTVVGLRDRHLVGASVPVAFKADALGPVAFYRGGIAAAPEDLARGDRYSVWSFAASPSPAQLARVGPDYPGSIAEGGQPLTIVPALPVSPFGTPGREREVEALLSELAFDERVGPYRPLFRAALRVVGRARSPYAATVALETWFRSGGGFEYDERPGGPPPGVPALVDFVTASKRGYCQHYAGAMALMLRYLGIPARVAAGFTTGRYDEDAGEWTVTDHDAHTWVEVWFRGYGWLPFDPTPVRGGLAGSYTASSRVFDAPEAMDAAAGAPDGIIESLRALRVGAGGLGGLALQDQAAGARPAEEGGRSARPLLIIALLVFLGGAGIGLAKLGMRRARYLARDPRLRAGACRRELLDFLRDQGIEVGPSSTVSEVGEVVERRFGIGVDRFASAASEARFGPPEGAPAAARHSRRELRLLLRRLRWRLTRMQRLHGLVSLRSLRSG